MSEPDLSGILGRTRGTACASCGANRVADEMVCETCGTEFGVDEDDEREISVMAGEAATTSGEHRSVPLERAKNFIALRSAADDALAGRIDDATYKATISRIKMVAQMGLKVFESDVARERFASLPEEERAATALMELGFRRLHDGVARMESWLASGDETDVQEGWREAEQGWIDIDQAQEMALEIAENRES